MNILHISVINKVATYQQRDGAIVCGNSDYQIEFTFDDEWNASTYKTARFVYSRGGAVVHQDVDFTGNTVTVPVLTKTTEVYVGIFAGELRTSTPAVIPCKLSILCESGTPAIPSPETDARIMQLLNLAISQQDSAEEAATTATEAKEATERYASEVKVIVTGNEAYTKAESDALHTDTAPPIVLSAEGEEITVTDSAKRGLHGLKIYGKTTQNGTPTPDNTIPLESVGGDGEVVTTVEGGNLFDGEILKGYYGADDGSYFYYENETCSKNYISILPNTQYCVIGTQNYVLFYDFNQKFISSQYYNSQPFTTPTNARYVRLNFGTADVNSIMLNEGSTALPYQPYKEPQQLITTTPNGLNGLPVSSGGNFTDSNGQQWRSDEIDFERGVTKRRTILVDLGTLNWTFNGGDIFYSDIIDKAVGFSNILCGKYPNAYTGFGSMANNTITGNDVYTAIYVKDSTYTDATAFKNAMQGVMLLYELATPTETPLSAEDIAEYKKLHTNYPTTVITSEGYMEVKYNADTKTYIDNKFAQLAAQIINNV